MRFWTIEKYWTSLYLVLSLLFITGLSFAEDSSKVGSKYLEMSKGKNNAPIIFVEYASLTCPACAAFHKNVYPKLNKEYVDTGKIKYIHREIYFDRAGLWAALTARCTNTVSHYFGMIDLLYAEQPKWSRSELSDEIVNSLLKISAKSGIEKAKAISCLEDQEKALDLVNEFRIYVDKDAIESTPTFIINGKKYTNRSYDELKKIIDKELAN